MTHVRKGKFAFDSEDYFSLHIYRKKKCFFSKLVQLVMKMLFNEILLGYLFLNQEINEGDNL